jgi:hypothetical protein
VHVLVRVDAVIVRTDGGAQVETYRLVTSLLDHHLAPAAQLAVLYHQRWESENGYAEIKNRLRGAGFVLRSKSPELVCPEVYALLTVYQALCSLEAQAAENAGIDPQRISFTLAVQRARLTTTGQDAADAETLRSTRRTVFTGLCDALLPPRRNRRRPRVKKPPKNTFETKRRDQPRAPDKVTYDLKITQHPPLPAKHRKSPALKAGRTFRTSAHCIMRCAVNSLG